MRYAIGLVLVLLISATGCTEKNIVGLERAECEGDSYVATYYPQWADSVLVYGECDG